MCERKELHIHIVFWIAQYCFIFNIILIFYLYFFSIFRNLLSQYIYPSHFIFPFFQFLLLNKEASQKLMQSILLFVCIIILFLCRFLRIVIIQTLAQFHFTVRCCWKPTRPGLGQGLLKIIKPMLILCQVRVSKVPAGLGKGLK